MSRRSATTLVVVVVAVLALVLAALSQTLWRPFRATSTTGHDSVAAIEVRGTVDGVTFTRGDRTEVRQQVSSWRPGASGKVTVSGTTLTLDGCGRWCRVRYEVTAPAGIDLTGAISAGNLRAENLGAVAFTTSSGSIDLTAVAGPVSAETSSGNIRIKRPSDTVEASASSGNVIVTDARAEVSATTSSGNVELTLVEPANRRTPPCAPAAATSLRRCRPGPIASTARPDRATGTSTSRPTPHHRTC